MVQRLVQPVGRRLKLIREAVRPTSQAANIQFGDLVISTRKSLLIAYFAILTGCRINGSGFFTLVTQI